MKINKETTETLFNNLSTQTFEEYRNLARHLGAHYKNGQCQFGFWLPEAKEKNISEDNFYLEILRPLSTIDFTDDQQTIDFQAATFSLQWKDDFAFVAIEGIKAGSASEIGDFYQIKYKDQKGRTQHIFDPLSYSIPFGAFAPAEVYDMASMFENRTDKAHFQAFKNIDRLPTPVNILQLHPHSTTPKGTLEGIAELFQNISNKHQNREPLTKSEKAFANHDGIQLLPIMPQIDIENGEPFFKFIKKENGKATFQLTRHYIQNWGYDIVIAAASAINPSLLATKRPHELLHLIETLHNFQPQPKKIILDIVYGHSDNQAQLILNKNFFLAPGMYGQEMNVQHPIVRAIMLESQRRIGNYGIDGIRVDAAQDIIYHDENGQKQYDNDYLRLMNEMIYEVAGIEYKTWMVFEDGRPWPQPDWNIATTYKVVHELLGNALQWGPLTFVNNKPLIFGFWIERFWRVQQIAFTGEMWVTGGSNHDTYRGLAQINPSEASYNSYLGDNLRAVAHKAYNNPAARLLDHAFLPGVPMEFINASTDTPWGFLRNTDDHWGVKVMAQESHFFDWFVDEHSYTNSLHFKRLKALGFKDVPDFIHFKNALNHLVKLTDYDFNKMIKGFQLAQHTFPTPNSIQELKAFGKAYMEDAYDFCNVGFHVENAAKSMVDFNYQLRDFRMARPNLLKNLSSNDVFNYWHSPNGAVVYYGMRTYENEQLLVIANMEGATTSIPLNELELPILKNNEWQLALKTPDCQVENLNWIELKDSEGVVFLRR